VNNKFLHIAVSILKYQLIRVKNWVLYEKNRLIFFFLLLLIFIAVSYFSIYFNDQSSLKSQVNSILLSVIVPFLTAKSYLNFSNREDSLLYVFINKGDLLASKQILSLFISLSAYVFLLLSGIIPHLLNIPVWLLITSELIFILILGWVLPYLSKKISFGLNIKKSNRFWNFQISNINLLPIRGIILREFLSFWRENKKYIWQTLINLSLLNLFLVFFIVNNDSGNFFIWAALIQIFALLYSIMAYPTNNDTALMLNMSCKVSYIFKGEYVFWFVIFLLYYIFIIVIYSFVLPQISIIEIVIPFLIFLILLAYILFVRLAYADNKFVRNLIYLMIIVPVTIPFVIYNSYQKLKC